MNTCLACCLLEKIRKLKLEIRVLQKRLDESAEFLEIARCCYLIEQYWLYQQELQNCLENHLTRINIVESINAFEPKIYTR
ncbi:MAG: hypothetical protein EOP42_31010 [Sphingobacteriaceae bacterium]|nr:MAG: hypothetical protein EOP42_31010 [Sphingobacteriaceae bacterium]